MNIKYRFTIVTFIIYTIPLGILYSIPFFNKAYGVFGNYSPIPIIFIIILLYCIYTLFSNKKIYEDERAFQIYNGIKKIIYFVFVKYLKGSSNITDNEKVSLLFYLVKIFFTPIMIGFVLNNVSEIERYLFPADISFTKANILNYYIKLVFFIFLFVDTAIFSLGYLIESKKLGNIVKSVEPTTLGWLVTVICYPPFNSMSVSILGWYSREFNNFGNINLNILFALISLFLFGIYVWATLALGWKSSNLTNRGIISKGPYRYVRHPAYISKNLSWWVMGIPFIMSSGILAVLSLASWSVVYYLRAMTEELHLMQDPDYIEYMKKTKYMFIPKIF